MYTNLTSKLSKNVGKVGADNLNQENIDGGGANGENLEKFLQLFSSRKIKEGSGSVKNSGNIDMMIHKTILEITKQWSNGMSGQV